MSAQCGDSREIRRPAPLVAEWQVMELLSIPFRIGDDGRPERIWQGSEAHAHQQALQFVSTKPGELPMSPLYGLDDPSFRSMDAAEVVVGMATYHPEVVVQSVFVYGDPYGVAEVVIEVTPATDVVAVNTERSVVLNA